MELHRIAMAVHVGTSLHKNHAFIVFYAPLPPQVFGNVFQDEMRTRGYTYGEHDVRLRLIEERAPHLSPNTLAGRLLRLFQVGWRSQPHRPGWEPVNDQVFAL